MLFTNAHQNGSGAYPIKNQSLKRDPTGDCGKLKMDNLLAPLNSGKSLPLCITDGGMSVQQWCAHSIAWNNFYHLESCPNFKDA